jgi:hypothetical protein
VTDDPREVWERVQGAQVQRWRDHVAPHLPERLLDRLADGPEPEPAD